MSKLENQMQAKFEKVSDAQLIRRIEDAPEFGYDDEAYELNRRLRVLGGKAWRWAGDFYHPHVELYELPTEGGDRE
ncbi:hypothetical protein KRR55_06165 [Paeniglutamicibacter sp. ABSL32-1]|uniref:hypothetical protein n=1 Tax=Paeniglutamicibacter quisquiliarum TaxID=2849498 RepID=UPI001C2CD060|nr:hypothetical protein [Paeniglutamicibacter quisquiliarum]MBV1778697.1 hypothetical protein [Paeniglutamicibacter quisquiliarum]